MHGPWVVDALLRIYRDIDAKQRIADVLTLSPLTGAGDAADDRPGQRPPPTCRQVACARETDRHGVAGGCGDRDLRRCNAVGAPDRETERAALSPRRLDRVREP